MSLEILENKNRPSQVSQVVRELLLSQITIVSSNEALAAKVPSFWSSFATLISSYVVQKNHVKFENLLQAAKAPCYRPRNYQLYTIYYIRLFAKGFVQQQMKSTVQRQMS